MLTIFFLSPASVNFSLNASSSSREEMNGSSLSSVLRLFTASWILTIIVIIASCLSLKFWTVPKCKERLNLKNNLGEHSLYSQARKNHIYLGVFAHNSFYLTFQTNETNKGRVKNLPGWLSYSVPLLILLHASSVPLKIETNILISPKIYLPKNFTFTRVEFHLNAYTLFTKK